MVMLARALHASAYCEHLHTLAFNALNNASVSLHESQISEIRRLHIVQKTFLNRFEALIIPFCSLGLALATFYAKLLELERTSKL